MKHSTVGGRGPAKTAGGGSHSSSLQHLMLPSAPPVNRWQPAAAAAAAAAAIVHAGPAAPGTVVCAGCRRGGGGSSTQFQMPLRPQWPAIVASTRPLARHHSRHVPSSEAVTRKLLLLLPPLSSPPPKQQSHRRPACPTSTRSSCGCTEAAAVRAALLLPVSAPQAVEVAVPTVAEAAVLLALVGMAQRRSVWSSLADANREPQGDQRTLRRGMALRRSRHSQGHDGSAMFAAPPRGNAAACSHL